MRKDYLPFGKPNFTHAETEVIAQVLKSGWIGMGKEVLAFEEELSTFLEAEHVVTVDSCTSALFLSLIIAGIKEGDEVIVPTLTWCSTANTVIYCGAKPVFCDVEEDTLCLSVESVLKQITKKTKAVIVVHYGGLAVDVDLLKISLPAHIKIIEDAAHAFGSCYSNRKKVGASGNLTCFSFYANKNLSTGEGGAVALFNKVDAERLRSLRQQGMPVNSWKRFSDPQTLIHQQPAELGYKMNYIDLHACIGRIQLKRMEEFTKIRARISETYVKELSKLQPGIRFQSQINSADHSKHLFVISLPVEKMRKDRDNFVLSLREKNIGAGVHYFPLHKMDFYAERYGNQSLPVSEKIFKGILTLPISATMTADDTNDVIETFISVFKNSL